MKLTAHTMIMNTAMVDLAGKQGPIRVWGNERAVFAIYIEAVKTLIRPIVERQQS